MAKIALKTAFYHCNAVQMGPNEVATLLISSLDWFCMFSSTFTNYCFQTLVDKTVVKTGEI